MKKRIVDERSFWIEYGRGHKTFYHWAGKQEDAMKRVIDMFEKKYGVFNGNDKREKKGMD